MLNIRDSVVGNIEPTETELALIEHGKMQRLRHIKQVGFASLVYPGANHTRFEHSLGVMFVTRQLFEQVSDESNEELECAGLMHDIGHGAFSHCSDDLLNRYLKTTHEKIGEEVIKKSSIKDIIQKSGLSMNKLIDYFNGNGLGLMITGALGSDRLDYLVRDAHYAGVAYGLIDYQHIRNKLTLYDGKPAIYEQGLVSAENMLLARYSMFNSVYHHHTSLIAEGMYTRAVSAAIDSKEMNKEELKELNDWQMLTRLLEIKQSKDLTEMLVDRRLYKRAYYDYVADPPKPEELAQAIERGKLSERDYTIKLIKVRLNDGGDVNIVDKDGKFKGRLTELSPLIKTLTSTLSSRQRLLVSCDKRNVDKVRSIVEKVLG